MGAKDHKGHNARFLAFSMHNVRTVTLLDNATYMYRPMSGEIGVELGSPLLATV